ncbi:Ubiquitin carboxyl-terminal hydrolase [Venustampulla echinocandica]|uniref:Ubiquitin carboxyl-terminal hydrolase n=1 Tax=Venustampulla echinocandica TaxID=2656787 RepID=A0A370TBX2_9HELO|nr:Ubiquitin carboxyl-terminal hydrolase [Venustampulla echinocandica]RDL31545.1 Ubiquitin carboxyl-terminal hydrolase [Venustampulla echinocandica]
MKYVKHFEPIESDPRILTELMHRLGVQEKFGFHDVLDYTGESQQPALALIVIFPESERDELQKATAEAERTPIVAGSPKFLRQTIDNSCGLIAVLHCVLNTVVANSIKPNSILDSAIRSGKGITTFLEESKKLEIEYQSAVKLGETEIPDDIKYHYVALVGCQDNKLYELDGERLSPLIRGSSSKAGYILNEHEQIARIIDSFAHGGIDCSLYKLS